MLLWLGLALSSYLLIFHLTRRQTLSLISAFLAFNTFRFHGFTQQQFTDLLTTTVKNYHFLSEGKFIIKGMVLPWSLLGSAFANIFLSFHERTWLADCSHTFKPMFYRRYVDDCFLIFQSKEQMIPFLDYLNSKHLNN